MYKYAKRLLSALLCISTISTFVPVSFAHDTDAGSYFDFDSSEYSVSENGGNLTVKIIRHGDGIGEADIMFKAADFISTYGTDYVILDDNGTPVDKVYGEKPNISDLTAQYDEDIVSSEVVTNDEQVEETNTTESDVLTQPVSEATVEDETEIGMTDAESNESVSDEMTEKLKEEKESEIDDALESISSYFLNAEGAFGKLHFKDGEKEKTITINIIDNDVSEADKIFMLALLGTNSEDTSVAANATTYVTIVDDEEPEETCVDLEESSLYLDAEKTSDYITIRRTSGLKYFSFVYLSTVKQTAKSSAYKAFDAKQIAFLPGESEKKVKITGYDFTEDAEFGLILEGGNGICIGCNYATVYISKNPADSNENAISLMSLTQTVGEASKSFGFTAIPGGWEAVVNGADKDSAAEWNNSNLKLRNVGSNTETMLYTKEKQNLTGVRSIGFTVTNSNPVDASANPNAQNYTVDVSVDNNKSYADTVAGERLNGDKTNHQSEFTLDGVNESGYIRFAARTNNFKQNNVTAELSNLQYNYAKYTLSAQDSCETFSRKIYDFTADEPTTDKTFYDGDTEKEYNPGSVEIKHGSGFVTEFYPSESNVTISAKNADINNKRGIYLSGVYFAENSIGSVYTDGKYTKTNVYFVKANSNNEVNITLNSDFIKTLKEKGVISDVHSDKNIKIYPVFEQKNVTVNFENADRNDKNADTMGKYDSANLGSYIKNVVESSGNGKLLSKKMKNGLEYYSMNVPFDSVIRVEAVPAENRTVNGISVSKQNGSTEILHHENDLTKADITADSAVTVIKPSTGEQIFSVAYSPKNKNDAESLEGAVEHSDSSGVSKTDADGNMQLSNPHIGKQYSLTANAPAGYYVSWANMSNDTNNNGEIDNGDKKEISATNGNKSINPKYSYGNNLILTLDNDTTKYYYEFLPVSNENTVNKTGNVLREVNSLYNLLSNVKTNEYSPVANADVNIGGFNATTDNSGNYSIELLGLPSFGTASAKISADGCEYFANTNIGDFTSIRLPALEVFKAEGISANYENNSCIYDDCIIIKDDYLTITAAVSSDNSLKPTSAEFFMCDKNGTMTNCGEDSNFTVTGVDAGGKFMASLRFNPKAYMQNGYKLYVRFADQNGRYYAPIDIGYTFVTELELAEFVFPPIGKSSLANVNDTEFTVDILNNVNDGNLAIGGLYNFDVTSQTLCSYNGQSIATHCFGWDNSFDDITRNSSKVSADSKMKKLLNIVNSKNNIGNEISQNGKFSVNRNFTYNVNPRVGFSITLSQRNYSSSKQYFEDLSFFVKDNFASSSLSTITLPIGLGVAIDSNLSGDIVGVYHMYNSDQSKPVEYTTDDFDMFKKFENSIRREGYLFLNPKVSVSAGINVGIAFVTADGDFDFDMDFCFDENGTSAYGDVDINLEYAVEIAGFTVYSTVLRSKTAKLFNTDGTNEHIDFDYTNSTSYMSKSMTNGGEFSLANKSDSSRFESPSDVNLMSVNNSNGTVEQTLRSGTTKNLKASITKINDTDMLLVFVDNATGRSDVNKRAVYYSIGDGTTWSEPAIIDDDGTFDDYPVVQDLGNDKIIVSWSSANKVHDDNTDYIDLLSSLNIKTVFFDKNSKSFGEVSQITKETSTDKCADFMAKAAYDYISNRVIMYYTKIEYDRERIDDQLENLTTAPITALVYRFYYGGRWNDETDYSKYEELDEEFKTNWYGQRFLYPAVGGKTTNLNVIDCDVISYSGLSLYAYTVDWDGDMNTTDDRDVFMQIYHFAQGEFTYILKMTNEDGYYASPKFLRSGNNTYLFFGAKNKDSEKGEIQYLNVNDIFHNANFKKTSLEDKPYYELCYNISDDIYVYPNIAAECSTFTDYTITADNNGNMTLLWTESNGNARQIMASVYTVGNADDNKEHTWSTPVALTNETEKGYYSGLGACISDGNIYIAGSKETASSASIVTLKHTMCKDVKVTDVKLTNEYPAPGSYVNAEVTLKNEGLLQSDDTVNVTLDVNGTLYTKEYSQTIPGGAEAKLNFNVQIPTDTKNVTFKAYITEDNAATHKLTFASDVYVTNKKLTPVTNENGELSYILTADVKNNGNETSKEISFKATVCENEKTIGSAVINGVSAGTSESISIPLTISDSDYTISNGKGSAVVNVTASHDNEEILNVDLDVSRLFDKEAIELLNNLTDVTFENEGVYSVKVGETINLCPEFAGVEDGKLKIEWLSSSDANVAYIDSSDIIVAENSGTTTLTGIVVPASETIDFTNGANGKIDWKTLIPSSMQKTVTAQIDVQALPDENPSPVRYTVSFNTNGGNEISTQKVIKNSIASEPKEPVKDGFKFDGWYKDAELTEKYNFSSPVSGNMTLYAKWTKSAEIGTGEGSGESSSGSTGGNSGNGGNSGGSSSGSGSGGGSMGGGTAITPFVWTNPFTDINESDWYFEYVKYVNQKALMSGVSAMEFAPNMPLTRGMLVTVLYRAEGEPGVNRSIPFADVNASSYYANAIIWAQQNGIVNGITESEFAPNENITREQIAAIMFRYAKYKGYDVTIGGMQIREFADYEEISDYAKEAMTWAVNIGLMKGKTANTLNPKDNATRAETATLLQRFIEGNK